MQSVEIEHELTYLAARLPEELAEVQPKMLMDVYIPKNPTVHSKLRLRRNGDTYEITKKILIDETDASTQQEFTIPIMDLEFNELIAASDKRIQKDRYQVVINGYNAEVDVFRGELTGLVLIDFEFSSKETKDAFVMPTYCLADVTQEKFIAGGELAGKSYDDIAENLARFNYIKLES